MNRIWIQINKWASETYISYRIPELILYYKLGTVICQNSRSKHKKVIKSQESTEQKIQTLCHKDCQKGWQTPGLYNRLYITYSDLNLAMNIFVGCDLFSSW